MDSHVTPRIQLGTALRSVARGPRGMSPRPSCTEHSGDNTASCPWPGTWLPHGLPETEERTKREPGTHAVRARVCLAIRLGEPGSCNCATHTPAPWHPACLPLERVCIVSRAESLSRSGPHCSASTPLAIWFAADCREISAWENNLQWRLGTGQTA